MPGYQIYIKTKIIDDPNQFRYEKNWSTKNLANLQLIFSCRDPWIQKKSIFLQKVAVFPSNFGYSSLLSTNAHTLLFLWGSNTNFEKKIAFFQTKTSIPLQIPLLKPCNSQTPIQF